MLTVYDFTGSGNGYKAWLLLQQLGVPYKRIERDILKGETRTPAFLKKNPNGRIPTLELDDGTFLFESGAILWYLAEGTSFAPRTRLERAQTLQWMFFEQYSHEPYIAVARFWKHFFDAPTPQQEANLPDIMKKGYAALDVMEGHLAKNDFFVGGRYGIADIALYAYTHVAHEGEFDLAPYPAITAWLVRVKSQPGHVSIDHKH
jgi:glutathione S-transferase